MSNGIFILISILSFSANTILTRFFQTKLQKLPYSIRLYQALFSLAAALAYFAVSLIQKVPFSTQILLPSVMFGICFAGALLFSAKCMEMGFMALSSVIINLSLILPVVFSWIVMDEPVFPNEVVGLVLILITLVLSSLSAGSKSGNRVNTKKWLLFVLVAFLCNGFSAVIQKQHKASSAADDMMLFMGFAYLTSAIIFTCTYAVDLTRHPVGLSAQVTSPRLLPVIALLSGLGSFAGNGILGYLCDKVSGGVLYPCINGGLSIVVALTSFLFFKERIHVMKIIAICTGVFAIIVLNI